MALENRLVAMDVGVSNVSAPARPRYFHNLQELQKREGAFLIGDERRKMLRSGHFTERAELLFCVRKTEEPKHYRRKEKHIEQQIGIRGVCYSHPEIDTSPGPMSAMLTHSA